MALIIKKKAEEKERTGRKEEKTVTIAGDSNMTRCRQAVRERERG